MKPSHKNNMGVTLMEVLVAIIIIGVFAAVFFPRYTTFIEKFKANAQMPILASLYDAQQRYRLSNLNEWFAFGDYRQLGVDIETSQHFNEPTLGCGTAATCDPGDSTGTTVSCGGSANFPYLVTVQRNAGPPMDYSLYILQDGTPACVDSASECDGVCQQFGFVSLEDL